MAQPSSGLNWIQIQTCDSNFFDSVLIFQFQFIFSSKNGSKLSIKCIFSCNFLNHLTDSVNQQENYRTTALRYFDLSIYSSFKTTPEDGTLKSGIFFKKFGGSLHPLNFRKLREQNFEKLSSIYEVYFNNCFKILITK